MLRRILRHLLRRSRADADLEEELQAHLAIERQQRIEAGESPEEARFAAQRTLGNTSLIKEDAREVWGFMWLDRLLQDLRYGCRVLKNAPRSSAVVVLTAALAIGANTSIFSVVDAVLLRPLPYRDAQRLVSFADVTKDNRIGLSVADFQYAAWREQAAIFDSVAAYASRPLTVTGDGEPEQLNAQVVTPGFLHVLGVSPMMGRDFTSADAAPRGGQVALLSYALWTGRFGGDPSVLSRRITLNGKPYSIAGILPRSFEFPGSSNTSLLLAMNEPSPQPAPTIYFYRVIARLKPGVTVGRAEADLALINGRLKAAFPKNFRDPRADARTRVTALHEHLVGNVRPVLLVLSGSVALVLLIACMNISILLLARGIARQKEIAVRTALGAGRGRVLMQLLTEGMLLALAGGVTGLALAVGGVRLLRAIAPADVPHIDSAGISGAVLAFNLALTVAAGILFGLAPIRGALRADPGEALKQTSRSASGTRGHKRIENLLVIVETAFALILLVGAGLLMRTVAGLTAIAPGFRPDDVVSARISLPYWKYPTDARQRAVMEELLEKLRFGPRVDWTGAVTCLPYGGLFMLGALEIEGRSRPSADPGSADDVAVNFAAGDYFKAMGIPVLDGRAIDGSDRMARPAVAMVNETLARRFFAGTRAVGSRIRVGGVTGWLEIVGVAGDVKQGDLASEPRTEVFQAAAQGESGGSAQTLVIHSTADSRILLPWLRAEIARVDKDLPPPEIETMRAQMSSLIESQTFVMRLLALFAGVAITLAATGIYGVLTYSVERRAHEIGIRLALGAKPRQVMGLVVGRGLRLASAGAILGIAGGLGLTRYLVSLLYGVTPHDPATLAGGAVVVLMVALATSYIPARRALDQDAIASLRVE